MKMSTETTELDVLDLVYRALKAFKNSKIKHVDCDVDNEDGSVEIILKDGTSWFISSCDIVSMEELME